ncbi:hypothetical protein NC99_39450 [Sunxiuqinia dokdonensis]|uniref:Uncharacterized protein n=1 Tax=Sunxiuqinia dokdonensis TaxID=1409788 RepID=A0A0L8V465_9BACT|nr:hypothetical protein NC99_39450 [Sunxiuqinia dokdonensis]
MSLFFFASGRLFIEGVAMARQIVAAQPQRRKIKPIFAAVGFSTNSAF